jgi:hypothetical protein
MVLVQKAESEKVPPLLVTLTSVTPVGAVAGRLQGTRKLAVMAGEVPASETAWTMT